MKNPPCNPYVRSVTSRHALIPRLLAAMFALAAAFWCSTPPAHGANNGIWTGGGATLLWSNTANWSGGTLPSGGGAVFNLPSVNAANMTVTLDSNQTITGIGAAGGIVFTGSAYNGSGGYTINANPGFSLTLPGTAWV